MEVNYNVIYVTKDNKEIEENKLKDRQLITYQIY